MPYNDYLFTAQDFEEELDEFSPADFEQEPETGLRPPETPEEEAAFARLAQQMMAAAEPVISMAPAIRSDAQVPAAPIALAAPERPEPWDPWAGRAFAGAEETGQPSLRRVVADPAIAALKGAVGLPQAAVGLVDVIPGVEGRAEWGFSRRWQRNGSRSSNLLSFRRKEESWKRLRALQGPLKRY